MFHCAFVVEHPFPTMPTLLHPPKAVTPHNSDEIHNQEQTTVYIDKDVTSTPKIPAPLYGPEKIVIPISSLYPGAEHVRTHPASIHEVHYEQEPKGKLTNWVHSLFYMVKGSILLVAFSGDKFE